MVVVDFGGGNLGSLTAALERRGASFAVSGDAAAVDAAEAAIVPGDGAFGATMRELDARGLSAALLRLAARDGVLLGICVGMQILYEAGDEHGEQRGLGLFPGRIGRFARAPRVPHMGWNKLEPVRAHPFTAGLDAHDYAYFLHSYRAPVDAVTLAACEHGERFAAIAGRGNVVGTQFHPEKSQRTGAKLLDNFLALCATRKPA